MDETRKSRLIIFYRNPEPGKVKSRLASTVGVREALRLYNVLAQHTVAVASPLAMEKMVYYSERIESGDRWSDELFLKSIQRGQHLGDRMRNAFRDAFAGGCTSVCIIGTDCYELTPDVVDEAFRALETHDLVLGPAADGGYYLLGMKRLHAALFQAKAWGTDSVGRDTLRDAQALQLTVHPLPVLRDIDREEDLPPGWRADSP